MESLKTDIAVIGSGIGGMCAAALLARAGYKTLILEGLGLLGGRYTCIEYNGYKIATGGHIVNHGKDDPICLTLDEVGAPEIEFREFKVPVKYRIGGKDILLEAKGGLRNLVLAAANSEEEARKVMQALYEAIRSQEPAEGVSLKEWLRQLTDNERIHNIFRSQAVAFTGVNLQDFPAGEFVRFLRTYGRLRGALVPRHTGKTIIEALRTVIEANGGRILANSRATQIVVEGGKARGVVAENGGRAIHVEARVVISNAGPVKTMDLAGERNFGESAVKQVSENVKPSVAMDYIIVSEKPLLDCLLFTTDARRTECWSPTTLFWPGEAPKGMHMTEGYAAPLSSEEYDPEEEQEIFLQDLKQEFPNFEACGGRVLLARRFCGEWPINRCFQGRDLPQATPVERLYNVGDGVKPSGWVGASGAAMSARLVAQDIKERIQPS